MRRFLKIIFKIYLSLGITILLFAISFIIYFLVSKSFFDPAFISVKNSLLSIIKDLYPAIAGTFLITIFSVVIATPIGIITGIYINEYTKGKIREFYIFLFKMLSGIPSIVIGVLGFLVIIILNKLVSANLKASFLISGLSVSVLILPYIVHSTIIALKGISVQIRIASLSLGAKKYQNIFRVLLPEGFLSLSSGIILSIGRAAEDTAVIMLTGAAAYAGIPNSIFNSFEALPLYIYYHTTEYQDNYELRGVFIAAIIIILISMSFMSLAMYLNKKLLSLRIYK